MSWEGKTGQDPYAAQKLILASWLSEGCMVAGLSIDDFQDSDKKLNEWYSKDTVSYIHVATAILVSVGHLSADRFRLAMGDRELVESLVKDGIKLGIPIDDDTAQELGIDTTQDSSQ